MAALRNNNVILSGFIASGIYLYLYYILYVSIYRITGIWEEPVEVRNVPNLYRDACQIIWKGIVCINWYIGAIVSLSDEFYYNILVYYPLITAPIWFGYGCLFYWAYAHKRLKVVLIVTLSVWLIFILYGWHRPVL